SVCRGVLPGPDQRVADRGGGGDLPGLVPVGVVGDGDAVGEQQLGWNRADAGGGGHGQRLVHVLGDRGRGATQRFDVLAGLGLRGRGGLGRRGRGRLRLGRRLAGLRSGGRCDLAVGPAGLDGGGRARQGRRCRASCGVGLLVSWLARLVVGEEFVPRRVYG